MRIIFCPVQMLQPSEETEFFAMGTQWRGRDSKDKFPVFLRPGKPAPIVDPELRVGKGHAVSDVECTKPSGRFLSDLLAHGLQERQWQRDSCHSLQDGTTVDLELIRHPF